MTVPASSRAGPRLTLWYLRAGRQDHGRPGVFHVYAWMSAWITTCRLRCFCRACDCAPVPEPDSALPSAGGGLLQAEGSGAGVHPEVAFTNAQVRFPDKTTYILFPSHCGFHAHVRCHVGIDQATDSSAATLAATSPDGRQPRGVQRLTQQLVAGASGWGVGKLASRGRRQRLSHVKLNFVALLQCGCLDQSV